MNKAFTAQGWFSVPIGIGLLAITLSMGHALRDQDNMWTKIMLNNDAQHLAPLTEAMLYHYPSHLPLFVIVGGTITSILITILLALLNKQYRDCEKLKEGKIRLRAVLDHTADGIALMDENGRIEDFNPASERLFGIKKADILGHDIRDIIPDYDPLSLRFTQTEAENSVNRISREVKVRRKDGTMCDIGLSVSGIALPDRQLYLVMLSDITERKQAEAWQKELFDKLADSNAELERFAYVASHDLREPLRIVANFASLLTTEYSDVLDEAGEQYLSLINEASSRMHRMVGDLLEYARVGNEDNHFVAVDGDEKLRHVLINLSAIIEEQRAVVHCDPMPVLYGNRVQLLRLFQNLIGNAIKFHLPGVAPEVHVSVEDKGDQWQFEVRDNGIGMASQYTEQIFEPFRQLQARNEYIGTGIGLAICKRIVEKHHGHIWAESIIGEGSRFYVLLPKN